MAEIDYYQVVRILSFNVLNRRSDAGQTPRNLPIDTNLAAAIRLVCSNEWRDAGNVLAVILRDDGPPILDLEQARAMLRAPDFPCSD